MFVDFSNSQVVRIPNKDYLYISRIVIGLGLIQKKNLNRNSIAGSPTRDTMRYSKEMFVFLHFDIFKSKY